MTKISLIALFTLSVVISSASESNVPTLKYDESEPASLFGSLLPDKKPIVINLGVIDSTDKAQILGSISREGIVHPPKGMKFKLKVQKPAKMDQAMIVNPDSNG